MVAPNNKPDSRQQAMTKIWEYLLSQGIMGYQFPTYDTSYMTDVQKMYEDMILANPNISYDSVLPKYVDLINAGDPRANQMAEYFRLIEEEGYSPKTFVEDLAIGPSLSENEKADLFQYAEEKASRDKAAYGYNQEMESKANLYGLPSPYEEFKLPTNVVQDLVRQKGGLTPAEAANRELLMLKRQENQQKKTLEDERRSQPTEIVRRDKKDIASSLFNATIGRIAPSTKIQEYAEVSKPATPKSLGGARGAMISALTELQKNELDFEKKLQDSLTQQIMQKYGTPFEAAVKEAARIAASRKKGASGNWPA